MTMTVTKGFADLDNSATQYHAQSPFPVATAPLPPSRGWSERPGSNDSNIMYVYTTSVCIQEGVAAPSVRVHV